MSQQNLAQQYADHLNRVVQVYLQYLSQNQLDAAWVHYGNPEYYFNDDHEKPYRANPFAIHLVPEPSLKSSWLQVTKDGTVTLYRQFEETYWEYKQEVDLSLYTKATNNLQVVEFADFESQLKDKFNPQALAAAVVVGPNHPTEYQALGFAADKINPRALILDLETCRRVKDEWETYLLVQAQQLAIAAHRKFKNDVIGGRFTEMQLLGNYLNTAKMQALEQGYTSIIAYNRNAAILHYNHLEFAVPEVKRSMLIDAGATYQGYQADLTRTYCLDNNQLFSDLILGVDQIKHEIIANMAPGVLTSELQQLMLRKTAELLIDAEIIVDCNLEQAMELKLPHHFIPHGFGHSMGIGVHDVLGHKTVQANDGQRTPHKLEIGNCWTIEPGIYFIDSLLEKLNSDDALAKHIDFDVVDEVYEHGGIRQEDNVILGPEGLLLLTNELE